MRHGYESGVHRALATAGLYFAGAAPAVQFMMFDDSTPAYPHPGLVQLAFAAHAVVWGCAVLRWLPAPMVLVSWSVICVTIAVQMSLADVAEPAAPRNISLTIAATAALLLPLRRALALTAAVSMASGAALLLAARTPTMTVWSIAVEIPIYAVSVTAALALAFRELHKVAREADDQARARLAVDRTVRRKELAAEASRHRARMMHDTVVNTLGAIANARIASTDDLVARRCAEDARMIEVLRRTATPINPSLRDVFTHAQEIDVELTDDDIVGLRDRLDDEEPWRRREIVSTLKETVTNIAKHAGVTHARMSYDAASFTVTVTDAGAGMDDVEPLARSLSARSLDAQTEVHVTSDHGRGTTVRLSITPLRDAATRLLESAAAGMAIAISAVMLAEFVAVTVVTSAFRRDWTVAGVLPPTVMWFVVATTLGLILKNAGRSPSLPGYAIAAAYLGLVAMTVLYNLTDTEAGACGLRPNLAWVGDAMATICAVLVLVDGRLRVVLPAVLLGVIGAVVTFGDVPVECGRSTFGIAATDLLVVGAFYILRRRIRSLSNAVAALHDDRIRRREQQERLAVHDALNSDGFDATLEFSKEILCGVAERPERVRDARTRTAASLEEGYLRALIGLTADIVTVQTKRLFVGAMDSARAVGVRVSVYVEPGVLNDDSAGFVVATLHAIIGRCAARDEVSIGVFGPAANPTVIIVAPPHSLDDYRDDTQRHAAQISVNAELGLVEMRWSDGAHRNSG